MIYLDNAATSFPKPEPVYQALDRFARTSLANPGRAGHRMAVAAERALDAARHALNQFFHGAGPERWIFTLNCTDGLNLAIKGVIQPGDHVVTTDLEHNSISRPLAALEKAGVITLTRVASEDGYVDPDAIKQAITPKTTLVAMTHASNVLGTVQPIEAIARDRPRGRGPVPGRRGPVGRRRADRSARDADRPAGVPRPQGPLRADRHRRALRRARAPTASFAPGAKGAPAATRRARPSRPHSLIFSKGAHPTCWASPDWPRASPGSPSAGRTACAATRSSCSSRSSTGPQDSDGWRIAGRWDPETHVGALSLIVPEALAPQDLGAILDTSFDIAVRPGLHCAPYIHRASAPSPTARCASAPARSRLGDDIAAFVERALRDHRGGRREPMSCATLVDPGLAT